ncbi:uncharacterized protein EI97DRAFT_478449 [Westerdykella ornata]|uniref:SRR1-like domain-containing protein n=1 Tax=Westerdykella ornata TaxID=318751 RepID=A0A6A6JZH9_WESOR|nr:uncharacterized protein EI97DRAFT_478449 [Westerdykella ornata]KAF2280469.1 hypothetical protein EI97DRAFT_478449 [Westerdykella ornata]
MGGSLRLTISIFKCRIETRENGSIVCITFYRIEELYFRFAHHSQRSHQNQQSNQEGKTTMSGILSNAVTEKLDNGPPSFQGDGLKHNLSGVYRMVDTRLSRGTLWTTDMVKEMQELSKRLDSLKTGDKYSVTAFDGEKCGLKVPPFNTEKESLALKIVGYQTLSQNVDDNGNYISENVYRRVPFFISAEKDKKTHILQQDCVPKKGICSWQKGGTPWKIWKQEFESGKKWAKYAKELENLVTKSYAKLKNVDKIVCIALGSLKTGSRIPLPGGKFLDREQPGSYVQHLAADKMRKKLEELTRRRIMILAQDPAYCGNCGEILRKELNIETSTHCDGLLNITANTLVISIAPSYDLIGLTCDITRDFGGPLAMLCNEIEMDETRWDGYFPNQPWLKWDQWDGTSRSYVNEDGNAADHTTRSMAEYEAKCTIADFGDFEDIYKYTYKEYRTKYSDVPFPGEVKSNRKKFVDGKKGDDDYKKEYGYSFAEHLALAERAHPKGPGPNFGELKLYVRES